MDKSRKIAIIVGSSVGSVVVITLIIVAIVLIRRRRLNKNKQSTENSEKPVVKVGINNGDIKSS